MEIMTQDQIKAIAEEIAKTLYDEDESYNHMLWWSIDPKERKAEELELTLKVLLRKYCIVEREKVMEKYNEADMHDYPSNTVPAEIAEYIATARSVKYTLTALFGTSMFNQNEE